MPWTIIVVRRDAGRGRDSPCSPSRSGRRRCERMYSSAIAVELGHRDARLEPLLDQRERAGDDRAGRAPSARSRCCVLRMITPRAPTLVERRPGSRRRPRRSCARRAAGTSLPGDPVVLDDRLGLRVVDREALRRSPRACRRGGPPRSARLSIRSVRDVVGEVEEEDRVEAAVDLARASRRARRPAPRCAGSRRARSPRRASASPSRSRISAIVSSSGTSSPRARIGSTCWPSSVRAAIAARNMSPVETCGIP